MAVLLCALIGGVAGQLSFPNADLCPGPVGGATRTLPLSTLDSLELIEDEPIGDGPCSWVASADRRQPGLQQTSNAWGNYPGDNTLMGCNAVVTGPAYTDFILEVDIFSGDNDGVGFVFGWKSANDHHVVLLENDRWPVFAVDDIPGPFIKFKRRIPGRPCLRHMNASTSCFGTYAHLNKTHSAPFGVPATYAQTFTPFPTTAPFRLTLIVKEGQARITFQEPLSQARVMLRAELPLNTYSGGLVGLTTYANNPRFSNLRLTDLSLGPQPSAFCDGAAKCQQDGDCGSGWEPLLGAPGRCPPEGNAAAVFFAVVGWLALGGLGAAAYFGRLPPSVSRRAGVPFPDRVVRLAGKTAMAMSAEEPAVPAVAVHVAEYGDERPAPTYEHSSSCQA